MRRLQASSTKWAPFWADSGEEDAAVRENPDRMALDAGEPADERVAVEGLELVEPAAVDEPRDDLQRIELVPIVLGDDPVEVGGVDSRRLGRRDLPGRRRGIAEVAHDLAGERERVLVRHRDSDPRRRSGVVWSVAPPSSSAVTSSPVAAFTSGGPPMKIVPVPSTMTVSSLIAGT